MTTTVPIRTGNRNAFFRSSEKLLTSMGRAKPASVYTIHELYPFYGVYCGQSALPIAPDKLTYLTSDLLRHAVVYRMAANFENTVRR